MNVAERYDALKDQSFDITLVQIRNGTIKTGKYSDLVKVDKNAKLKGKEFFKDGESKH